MDEVATPTSGSKRQRSRQACDSCRLRKRKCDGSHPCAQCVDFDYQCQYAEKHSGAVSVKARRTDLGTERSASSGAFSPPGLSHMDTSDTTHAAPTTGFPDGFSDSIRAKFATSESAIAFPRLLGSELSPGQAPKLHCFGWNVGTRLEVPKPNVDVTHFLTLDEANRLSDVYFEIVHPEIGFLDRNLYHQKVQSRWTGRFAAQDYDCVIAGVASLGSFFLGKKGHKKEAQLQSLLSEVLRISCGIYFPRVDHIAGYILQTTYLRLTTRPNASWTASCAMVHAMESAGLYKDHGLPPFSTDANLDISEIEYRRRLFWVAWSLHGILSKEYGRTKIQLEVTTKQPRLDHCVSVPFLSIAQCLEIGITTVSHGDKATTLMVMLDKLCELKTHTGFHQLLKTDMIFSVYRRLRLLQYRINKPYEERILAAASSSLLAAKQLVDAQRPWFNILSCPFQAVCVSLAIDSSDSLSLLPQMISTLDHIASAFGTFMVREAVQVANSLVRLARDKKASDLRKIESSIMPEQPISAVLADGANAITGFPDDPLLWGWMNDTFAWDLIMPSDKGLNGIGDGKSYPT